MKFLFHMVYWEFTERFRTKKRLFTTFFLITFDSFTNWCPHKCINSELPAWLSDTIYNLAPRAPLSWHFLVSIVWISAWYMEFRGLKPWLCYFPPNTAFILDPSVNHTTSSWPSFHTFVILEWLIYYKNKLHFEVIHGWLQIQKAPIATFCQAYVYA